MDSSLAGADESVIDSLSAAGLDGPLEIMCSDSSLLSVAQQSLLYAGHRLELWPVSLFWHVLGKDFFIICCCELIVLSTSTVQITSQRLTLL